MHTFDSIDDLCDCQVDYRASQCHRFNSVYSVKLLQQIHGIDEAMKR